MYYYYIIIIIIMHVSLNKIALFYILLHLFNVKSVVLYAFNSSSHVGALIAPGLYVRRQCYTVLR